MQHGRVVREFRRRVQRRPMQDAVHVAQEQTFVHAMMPRREELEEAREDAAVVSSVSLKGVNSD